MGCICPNKDKNKEDMILLDLQYMHGESYIRQQSSGSKDKSQINSCINKTNIEIDDVYDTCNKTSIQFDTYKTKKSNFVLIFRRRY